MREFRGYMLLGARDGAYLGYFDGLMSLMGRAREKWVGVHLGTFGERVEWWPISLLPVPLTVPDTYRKLNVKWDQVEVFATLCQFGHQVVAYAVREGGDEYPTREG